MVVDRSVGELDAGGEGLPELPPCRHDVGDDDGLAVGVGDPEGERLARAGSMVRRALERTRYYGPSMLIFFIFISDKLYCSNSMHSVLVITLIIQSNRGLK